MSDAQYDTLTDNVLEMYFNETTNYDTIADRCNTTPIEVANIVNDYYAEQWFADEPLLNEEDYRDL